MAAQAKRIIEMKENKETNDVKCNKDMTYNLNNSYSDLFVLYRPVPLNISYIT